MMAADAIQARLGSTELTATDAQMILGAPFSNASRARSQATNVSRRATSRMFNNGLTAS